MRVLLDECLPAGLQRELPGHDVTTVQRMGWAGTANGALLSLVDQAGFEAFVTVDRGVAFQQRLRDRSFGVVALRAPSNDIAALRPLLPALLAALPSLQPGQVVDIPGATLPRGQ